MNKRFNITCRKQKGLKKAKQGRGNKNTFPFSCFYLHLIMKEASTWFGFFSCHLKGSLLPLRNLGNLRMMMNCFSFVHF